MFHKKDLFAGNSRQFSAWTTKDIKTAFPDLEQQFHAEVARLDDLLDRRAALRTREASVAFARWAGALIDGYQASKNRKGQLDYHDLIERTRSLLRQAPAAAWVQYKLDRGITHLLVDEAQDTSPGQWQIIMDLTQEFFAGENTDRRGPRTVFAVGDEKQSIYSFQGADPKMFDEMRRYFATLARQAQQPWAPIELVLSFRSAPAIVQAVDHVFADPDNRSGLTSEGLAPVHETNRQEAQGRVEIWPSLEATKPAEPENWYDPLDHLDAQHPMITLSDQVAGKIAGWLADPVKIPGTDAPIKAGDILILVRRRKALTRTLNRSLKQHGVPVAGEDRLVLSEHLIYKDIIALLQFLLLPDDDLSLAAFLKAPPFDLSEAQLAELAIGRSGSLWMAMNSPDASGWVQNAAGQLQDLRHRLANDSPAALLLDRFTLGGWRSAYRQVMGREVDEIIDEILDQALLFEQTEPASAQGLLRWMKEQGGDIKREVDESRDEVRVMTVHGAKGLEAPIVFLIDDGSQPVTAHHDPAWIIPTDDTSGMLLKMPKDQATVVQRSAIEQARIEARDEYHRLLYVAMTRAKDWLFVCGFHGAKAPTDNWHSMVQGSLAPSAREETTADGEVISWVWPANAADAATASTPDDAAAPSQYQPPSWLLIDAVHPSTSDTYIAPSQLHDDLEDRSGVLASAPAIDRQLARERGIAIHRLLQSLPDVDVDTRRPAAQRYLNAAYPDWTEPVRGQMVDQVLEVLADPALAPLFGASSRAEVPVIGQFEQDGRRQIISGQIDRLAVLPDRVIIADYKTGRHVPGELAETPVAHRRQIAAYRQVVAPMYPDLPVYGLLIYADGVVPPVKHWITPAQFEHETLTGL